MNQTFEEFVGPHIDRLYHGALFLNAGEEPPAEDLVLWTLTGAFHEFRRIDEGSASEEWLEGKLVGAFLARAAAGSTDDDSGVTPPATELPSHKPAGHEPYTGAVEIDSEALFRAGADIPALARAAIWLVVFRRWSYREAFGVLNTDLDGLKELLQYRQVLLGAVVQGSSVDQDGTDQGGGR